MEGRNSFATESVDDEQRAPFISETPYYDDEHPNVSVEHKFNGRNPKFSLNTRSIMNSLSFRRRPQSDRAARRLLKVLCFLTLCTFIIVFAVGGALRSAAKDSKTLKQKIIDSVKAPDQTHPYCTTWPVNYTEARKDDPLPLSIGKLQNLPPGTLVVAVIFYGRSRNIDILDCYLRRNLAVHGGILDEVHFIRHTRISEDLEFLEGIVASEPSYKAYDSPRGCSGGNYGCIWPLLADPHTLYIKLDDDITWIHDDAFRHLAQTRIDLPEAWGVSANIINTPMMTFMHWHSGAIHPYLPQYDESSPYNLEAPTWRASQIPRYDETHQPDYSAWGALPTDTWDFEPPYNGHYWRPVDGDATTILNTPTGQIFGGRTYENHDIFLGSWAAAAQNHYSLLENIENDELERYWGAVDGGVFNMQFARYNLNFFAFWGNDIANNLPIDPDDEQEMTVTKPMKTGRPHVIDMRALVTHFHFNFQSKLLLRTDLLDRYRAYANEKICTSRNQKEPLTYPCSME